MFLFLIAAAFCDVPTETNKEAAEPKIILPIEIESSVKDLKNFVGSSDKPLNEDLMAELDLIVFELITVIEQSRIDLERSY